jgi:hypothetical protein
MSVCIWQLFKSHFWSDLTIFIRGSLVKKNAERPLFFFLFSESLCNSLCLAITIFLIAIFFLVAFLG